VHPRLGEHGVVLDLRLAERRSVAGNDDQLALAAAQSLEGLLVAKAVLAGLHDQRQTGVDGFIRLLGFFRSHVVTKTFASLERQEIQLVTTSLVEVNQAILAASIIFVGD